MLRKLALISLLTAVAAPAQFRQQTTEVDIPITAVDRNDRLVTDLNSTDLRLFDNGRERPITSLLLEEGPASVIFLVDVSGSMRKDLPFVQTAMENLLLNASQEDEFAMLEFSEHTDVTVPFSDSGNPLASRLKLLRASGATSLYDAVVDAMTQSQKAKHKRRAVVVISDGRDTRSRARPSEALRLAMESDVRVYAVELSPSQSETYIGDSLLERISVLTGGRYFATYSPKGIPDLVSRIDIHRYYRLAFRPHTSESPAKHRVELKWTRASSRHRNTRLYWRRSFEWKD